MRMRKTEKEIQITDVTLDEAFAVELNPLQSVKVSFANTDGFILVMFTGVGTIVVSDIPDGAGRGGIGKEGMTVPIYSDEFVDFTK